MLKKDKQQKKPVARRVRGHVGKMLGVQSMQQTRGYLKNILKAMWASRNQAGENFGSFEDAQQFYNLSNYELEHKRVLYVRYGLIYSLAFVLLSTYVGYLLVSGYLSFNLTYILALVILLLFAGRSFYFAHLIKERRLDIRFTDWLRTLKNLGSG